MCVLLSIESGWDTLFINYFRHAHTHTWQKGAGRNVIVIGKEAFNTVLGLPLLASLQVLASFLPWPAMAEDGPLIFMGLVAQQNSCPV